MDRPAGEPLLAEGACRHAAEIIAQAAGREDFARAEEILLSALALDPEHFHGRIRHLLGLACFHQERWLEAERHFACAARNSANAAARVLAEQARINASTCVQRPMHAAPELDPAMLLQPPALWLREPQDLEPLPPLRKPDAVRGALKRAWDRSLGLAGDGLILACHLLRDRKPLFAFESWDRRGAFRGKLELAGIRADLNRYALQSTYGPGPVGGQQPGQRRPPWTERFRTATGAWTTDDPMEGAAGTEIQRSGAPLSARRDRTTEDLPDPRRVSRALLGSLPGAPREEVPFLNLLALAWIQAELHDWVSHAPAPVRGFHCIELAEDDPLRERYGVRTLRMPRTPPNPIPGAAPLTFLSEVTHWWDASHIYGSDQATQDRLRGARGRMRIDGDLLPVHPLTGLEDSGFTRNWWVGLDLVHTLFVKHHNFICEALEREYPGWSGDQLFHTAHLINAAVMAKIHTVEWTPAVLPNVKVVEGMAANWWGLFQASKPFRTRRIRGSALEPLHPVVGGIAGGRRDNHGRPYGLSEEFTEVYRLHAGVPDEVRVRSARGALLEAVPTDATRGARARAMVEKHGMAGLLDSFGRQHMPALVHNNYPAFMSGMSIDGHAVFDVGTADVLRARERGVPAYNDFRRMLRLKPITAFEDLRCGPETVRALEQLYGKDGRGVERMDLIAGTHCERFRPENFGFGETVFSLFILMASRRLQADPFYTEKLNERYYTRIGMELLEAATLKDVLLQHYPELARCGLQNVQNAFEPWGTSWQTHPGEHPLAAIEKY
jgi:hypothetical protein